MSEPFELKILNGGLWMDFRQFIRLVEDLERFGVDAKIETNDETSAVFRLKEAVRNQ